MQQCCKVPHVVAQPAANTKNTHTANIKPKHKQREREAQTSRGPETNTLTQSDKPKGRGGGVEAIPSGCRGRDESSGVEWSRSRSRSRNTVADMQLQLGLLHWCNQFPDSTGACDPTFPPQASACALLNMVLLNYRDVLDALVCCATRRFAACLASDPLLDYICFRQRPPSGAVRGEIAELSWAENAAVTAV